MRYTARIPIKYIDDQGQDAFIAPGRRVPTELVDDGLLASRSIDAADDDEEPMVAPDKALARMNRAELDAIVAAEGVDLGDATTNAAIVTAIEAHRARVGAV